MSSSSDILNKSPGELASMVAEVAQDIIEQSGQSADIPSFAPSLLGAPNLPAGAVQAAMQQVGSELEESQAALTTMNILSTAMINPFSPVAEGMTIPNHTHESTATLYHNVVTEVVTIPAGVDRAIIHFDPTSCVAGQKKAG